MVGRGFAFYGFGFRIPSKELKRDIPLQIGTWQPCFRIPSKELKLAL